MVFVFGYPAGESEEPIFSGRVAGTVSDTLQFPIREIRDKTPPELELEVFAHGALCMCYSGQCALSAVIGGRSGNRGTCAQPCRLPYGFNAAKYMSAK